MKREKVGERSRIIMALLTTFFEGKKKGIKEVVLTNEINLCLWNTLSWS